MKIEIIKKENQADGHFNGGEILEKKPIGFPKMAEKLNLTPIYFIGHMLGLLVQKVQLVFIPTRDLKYAALF